MRPSKPRTSRFKDSSKARPLIRAEMERLYGDVPEDEREEDSLVTLLTLFPGQPLSKTLPPIFPSGGTATIPSFRFNWSAQPSNSVKTWLETPNLPSATTLFLREGVVEQTQTLSSTASGVMQTHTWTGLQIIDELDELELRNNNGTTLARGARDPNFADPGEP